MNRDEEAAAAKLWAVYVSEAEKYDRALVESWKSDMEGLLIFVSYLTCSSKYLTVLCLRAALFSSILTAFIIESYQSLNADLGDLTVHLLAQISQQLAASANGSTFVIPPPTSFSPNTSSIICNALWFTSLGFSLACALIATFVQQWARDFLHKTDMRSAPAIRARIFSYLYYGLKRFQMHTVVEIIPLLLHGSLILFFCGLVAFLIPVNLAMTVIAATVLGIVTAVYSALTLLPLRYMDCPYRTPLSGALWVVLRNLQNLWSLWHIKPKPVIEDGPSDTGVNKYHPSDDETMVEAMSQAALETPSERDYKALVWTMKSLSDDVELEPFVEAIPDILWGTYERRYTYEGHIQGLIHNPDVRLLDRLIDLHKSCRSGILSSEAVQHREITCYKAIWAIGTLFCSNPESDNYAMNLGRSLLPAHMGPLECRPYELSAFAITLWSTFLAVQGVVIRLRENLATCEAGSPRRDHSKELDVAFALAEIGRRFTGIFEHFDIDLDLPSIQSNSSQLKSWIDKFLSVVPWRIVLAFHSQSAVSESIPYRYWQTRNILSWWSALPSSLKQPIEAQLKGIICEQMPRLNAESFTERSLWVFYSIQNVLSLWAATDADRIPGAIIFLLNNFEDEYRLVRMLCPWEPDKETLEIHLLRLFPRTILHASSGRNENTFTALWQFASTITVQEDFYNDSRVPSIEKFLQTLSMAETAFTKIIQSSAALLKVLILRDRHLPIVEPNGDSAVFNATGPRLKTMLEAIHMSEEDEMSVAQWSELRNCNLHMLSEPCLRNAVDYLEQCIGEILPYKAANTFKKITDAVYLTPAVAIHPTLQIRLADSIESIFASDSKPELSDAIVTCPLWSVYSAGVKTEGEVKARRAQFHFSTGDDPADEDRFPQEPRHRFWPWLDNPEARRKIRYAFADCERKLASSPVDTFKWPDTSGTTPNTTKWLIQLRLQRILQGMDSWHPEPSEEAVIDEGTDKDTAEEGENSIPKQHPEFQSEAE